MAEPNFQSPLAALGLAQGAYAGPSLRITERVGLGHVLVRLADPRATPDLAPLERVEAASGYVLPRTANRIEGQDPAWIRVAPSRWFAVTNDPAAVLARLDAARDELVGVFDLTAARCAFAIEGAAAGELLACGCPLDLDHASFPSGTTASSLLGQAPVLLRRHAVDRFDLHVDAAMAPYMWQWLREAAREFET